MPDLDFAMRTGFQNAAEYFSMAGSCLTTLDPLGFSVEHSNGIVESIVDDAVNLLEVKQVSVIDNRKRQSLALAIGITIGTAIEREAQIPEELEMIARGFLHRFPRDVPRSSLSLAASEVYPDYPRSDD